MLKKLGILSLLVLLSACDSMTSVRSSAPKPSPTALAEALPFENLHMVTATSGWAVQAGSGDVLTTIDGGRRWKRVTPWLARSYANQATYFLDQREAWLVGAPISTASSAESSVIFQTADAGKTWRQQGEVSLSGPPELFAIDLDHAWLSSEGPCTTQCINQAMTLMKTADGGGHWTNVMTSQPLELSSLGALPATCRKNGGVAFVTPSRGWASGRCLSGPPFFFETDNGGNSWHQEILQETPGLPSGVFRSCECEVSPARFVSVEDGATLVTIFPSQEGANTHTAIYVTSDQGHTWTGRTSPVAAPAEPPDFVTPTDGWITDGTTVYVTHDGAKSWAPISPNVSLDGAHLDFVSRSVGFALIEAYGKPPALYETRDGGQSWAAIAPVMAT